MIQYTICIFINYLNFKFQEFIAFVFSVVYYRLLFIYFIERFYTPKRVFFFITKLKINRKMQMT